MDDLLTYIDKKFAVCEDVFLKALKLSPNAQGYLSGAITEFVLRDYLENKGYEVKRIKEKWEGEKHPNHHGDFYIRKKGDIHWYVLESKGVKSNSEKWHGLFNRANLLSFLVSHLSLIPFENTNEVDEFLHKYLPLFDSDFSGNFYTYNEVLKYDCKKDTDKARAIEILKNCSVSELEKKCSARIKYTRSYINIVETHLVSGGSGRSARTQATPRIDEFNILSLDLFLRTGKHEFIFVDPKKLAPSSQDKNHLQQNYIVDILIKGLKNKPSPLPPWSIDIDSIYKDVSHPINPNDMQVDERSLEEIEEEIENS